MGDFGDLRQMVDWAVRTGMKVIQLLPVNDTTTDGYWHDSYPYNITSCFALHPTTWTWSSWASCATASA